MRTIVFIDYQNMYRSARDAFDWRSEGGRFGNFRPYGLGRQAVRDPTRVLTQVRVYTGIHIPQRNPKEHGHMQRRMAAWIVECPEKVEVFPRPLAYKKKTGAQEKGVDVEIAIDLVRLAIDDFFDVAVIASADTDLVPALQLVADRCPEKIISTLAYAPLPGREGACPQPLDLASHTVERRFITKRDFDRIAEKRDFYIPTADESALIDPDRWAKIRQRYPGQST